MTRVIRTIGTTPVITNPQQQTQQATQQTQQPSQQPVQQQQQKQSGFNFDFSDGLKLAEKGWQKLGSNIWASGGGSVATGGAATGAVSASGGTYVTGAGLAGTPGAIHTTAGAAGSASSGGLLAGAKGGLAAAGAGIVGGFLGGKIFGTEDAATGASVGASIGMAFGPLGALAGGFLGGLAGKIFGGGAKNSYYSVAFGDQGMSRLGAGKVYQTDLGAIKVYGKRDGYAAVDPSVKAITDSDKQVAALFNEDQLTRVKVGIKNANSKNGTRWTQNPQRAQTILQRAVTDRYAAAVGGLDNRYSGLFKRVSDDKNMGGLISTLAQLDRDIQSNANIFAGSNVKNGSQALNFIAKKYKLGNQPVAKTMATERPTELTKPTGRPLMIPNLGGIPNSWKSKEDTSGWTYYSGNSFGRTSGWYPSQGQFGGYGSYSQVLKMRQNQWDNEKKKLDEANSKRLGAWEKKVLDAYVNNYQQGVTESSAANVAKAVGQIQRDTITPSNPSIKTERSEGLLNSFEGVKTGGFNRNRANRGNSDATNAVIINSRG